ncbi:MAG: hypothetical protein CO125_04120 [Hydrogenophilales bacterium CG_4_9_14_3_um_filter_59_35]|nr:MAG: hypothetical protein COW70_02395 [Hydrogenophilales bacterium CG18_big_fil_WC_8_21_14_2_50_58_12]PIY01567.1 MAG: hypothetical protein COZ23_02460 [Hydrogenophilales bacterium CG_4_10_14_3_um_filter_58_23]PJB07705.1 MAG: hypothetical protein CO125_04120 [Hydrogenophilales bacterium CG_4_9_14_3_um_filter_59_35]
MAREALVPLLGELTSDSTKRERALAELEVIIDEYRHALPHEVSQTREELNGVLKSLEKSAHNLDKLSPRTVAILCEALDGPRGQVTFALQQAIDATKKAIALAHELPHRRSNSHLTVLACQVAQVMRDILEIKASRTRDDPALIDGSRGGGTYARLLRKVIECAGDTPPDDLYPLISKGLELMADPHGDKFNSV